MKFKNNPADRFWLLCLIFGIFYYLYKIFLKIQADPILYEIFISFIIFFSFVYLVICFVVYYTDNNEQRRKQLELWNIVSIISYFINNILNKKI